MSRTVIVGLDGTAESRAAADWGAREARLRSLDLTLVHARNWQPYVYAPLAGMSLPPDARELERNGPEKLLADVGSALRRSYPDLEVSSRVVSDEPVSALLNEAARAELLVLGSRGLSGITGFIVGSVAHGVAARAAGPVVFVRGREHASDEHGQHAQGRASAATPYRDVVLGLDCAHPDAAVLGFAFDAAVRRDVRLRVVHVWNVPPYYYGYGGVNVPGLKGQLESRVRQDVADVVRPWRAKFPGVEVVEEALVGSAGLSLVAESRNASLVVVGRRKRRAPVGGHIGPVTQAVLHHCAAPVAVVPHD
ncbi:universal stress protein [Streptomyces sp. BH097]|uniref:universal stress protein n=1 Tax=unclassified Streptomyces TaxID=2593676 RepID=UPI003BB6FB78